MSVPFGSLPNMLPAMRSYLCVFGHRIHGPTGSPGFTLGTSGRSSGLSRRWSFTGRGRGRRERQLPAHNELRPIQEILIFLRVARELCPSLSYSHRRGRVILGLGGVLDKGGGGLRTSLASAS